MTAERQGSTPSPTFGSSLAPVVGVTAPSSPDSRTGEVRGTSRGRTLRRDGALVAILAVVAVVGAIQAGVIGGSPADGGAPGVVASPAGAVPPAGAASPAGAVPPVPTPVTSASTVTPSATPVDTGSPRTAPVTHVVVRDENLISIAAYYGVTVKAIQAANNIPDPGLIRVGDRLVIPPPP